jgi:sorbose reductase
MVEQKTGGSILFVASVSGHLVVYPQPQAAYGISKAAVVHLARSLAAEWAVHGIRVNSISPGYMDTVLNHGPAMEKLTSTWLSRVPVGRFGQPSELVGTVVMLCSNASSYTTGADIIVDGKYSD